MDVPFFCHDNHVIDIYLVVPPNLMGEDNVHESLVCGTNVFEDGGDDIIIVFSLV